MSYKPMLAGFRQFIMRGNMIDLAIGVVIGASFSAVVNSLVKDIINPLIAAIGGKPNFSGYTFMLHGGHFLLGDFINTLLTFLINAAVIYFFVVVPVGRFLASRRKPVAPTMRTCPECLSEVPREAKRCAFCTSKLESVKA